MSKIITARLPMYNHEVVPTSYGSASVVVLETNLTNEDGKPMFHYNIKALDSKSGNVLRESSGYVTKHFIDACSYARVKARKIV